MKELFSKLRGCGRCLRGLPIRQVLRWFAARNGGRCGAWSAELPPARVSADAAGAMHPYLLSNLAIERPCQIWCADITYIPLAKGFVYLIAVMDWFSRQGLSWRMSITMETDFCVETLKSALDQYGTPDLFNTDQGVQFSATAFIETLVAQGVRISMDGKGRLLDNIFIARLWRRWRSLKYEEVFLKAYTNVAQARLGIGTWLRFYNDERKHQSLNYATPSAVFSRRHRPVGMWTTQSGVAHIPTGSTKITTRKSFP